MTEFRCCASGTEGVQALHPAREFPARQRAHQVRRHEGVHVELAALVVVRRKRESLLTRAHTCGALVSLSLFVQKSVAVHMNQRLINGVN